MNGALSLGTSMPLLLATALIPWVSQGASTSATRYNVLFAVVLVISTFFFVLVTGAMVYFVIKYRRRPHQRATQIKGDRRIETAWTVIPSVILAVLFVLGFKDYMDLSVPPSDTLDVRVLGEQWNWTFEYPRDGISTNELVVPVGRATKLTMSSKDVIHSFYVPEFRIKRDVLPNRYTVLWFTPTVLGTYDVFCAEYCGTAHSQMITHVKVVTDAEYRAWIESGGGMSGKGMSAVDFGRSLFRAKGCETCHSMDGTRKTGPSLLDKYGAQESLLGGGSTLVDDNYLRESIMNPNAKVVEGYSPIMPTFAGRLTDEQVNAIIEYIKANSKKQ